MEIFPIGPNQIQQQNGFVGMKCEKDTFCLTNNSKRKYIIALPAFSHIKRRYMYVYISKTKKKANIVVAGVLAITSGVAFIAAATLLSPEIRAHFADTAIN